MKQRWIHAGQAHHYIRTQYRNTIPLMLNNNALYCVERIRRYHIRELIMVGSRKGSRRRLWIYLMRILLAWVSVCWVLAWSLWRPEESVEFFGTDTQAVVNCHGGVVNWTQVICKSNKYSSQLSHLSSHKRWFLKGLFFWYIIWFLKSSFRCNTWITIKKNHWSWWWRRWRQAKEMDEGAKEGPFEREEASAGRGSGPGTQQTIYLAVRSGALNLWSGTQLRHHCSGAKQYGKLATED